LVQLTVSVSLLVLACPFPCITLLYEYLSDVIEQECDSCNEVKIVVLDAGGFCTWCRMTLMKLF